MPIDEEIDPADILIVDDTPENLKLLMGFLQARGHRVRPATNGPTALAAAEVEPPDLVLLDINMVPMNGYEVCERLKAHPALAAIPVIFLSARSEPIDKVRAFEVGGVDYVSKPFSHLEMLSRVNAHLHLKRLREEIEAKNRSLEEKNTRLLELEELRDDLVHMIVHDMRSPITIVHYVLDVLGRAVPDLPEERRHDLAMAQGGCRNLIRLVDDILDVSRMEAGEMPLEKQSVDLREVARRTIQTMAFAARRHRVHLSPGSAVTVSADPQLVERVLGNFLGNAFKHTPEGRRIEVEVRDEGEGKVLAVRDDGPGIPREQQERIFEKFKRVRGQGKSGTHSAGLGLAFCRLAAEEMGGRVGLESEPRRGSMFWIELPAADAESTAGEPDETTQPSRERATERPHEGDPAPTRDR